MMLPMRISVSVTPAAWAGCTAAGLTAANMATKRYSVSLVIVIIFINVASNAKLPGTCDAYPAVAMIASKMGLLKSNVVAGCRMGGAERYPSCVVIDGYRF